MSPPVAKYILAACNVPSRILGSPVTEMSITCVPWDLLQTQQPTQQPFRHLGSDSRRQTGISSPFWAIFLNFFAQETASIPPLGGPNIPALDRPTPHRFIGLEEILDPWPHALPEWDRQRGEGPRRGRGLRVPIQACPLNGPARTCAGGAWGWGGVASERGDRELPGWLWRSGLGTRSTNRSGGASGTQTRSAGSGHGPGNAVVTQAAKFGPIESQ